MPLAPAPDRRCPRWGPPGAHEKTKGVNVNELTSRPAAGSRASAKFTAARLRWAMLALPLLVALLASDAAAAISLVKNIGTNASTTTGTTIPVTVPAAGVAAGNTVIVTIALDPTSGSVTCADTKGNSYSKDADVTNGSAAAGARTVIFSARVATALTSGNTITVTHPSVATR